MLCPVKHIGDPEAEYSGAYRHVEGELIRVKYVVWGKKKYWWTTEAFLDPEDDFRQYWYTGIDITYPLGIKEGDKLTRFRKRSSAKKSALKRREAHKRKNEAGKRANRCNKCDEHAKLKGDYLCRKCRYGS